MSTRPRNHVFSRFPFLYWLLPFLLVIPFILQNCTDWFYMIPTGEYILKNGIPQTNPFNVVEGLHIVIQNWAFCVTLYLCSLKIGLTGVQLLGCAEYLLFSATCFRMAKRAGYKDEVAGWFVMASDIVMASVMGSTRPAILTTCAVLFVMDAFLQYEHGDRKRLFLTLPIAAVFVTNIQSSNFIFLFCPVVAYFTATICGKRMRKEKSKEASFLLCASGTAVLVAAFLNPYGLENFLYLFRSLGHVDADELEPIMLLSGHGLFMLCAAYATLIILWRRLTCGHRINTMGLYRIFLLVGFFALSTTCIRNVLFLIPAFLYVWGEIYDLCYTAVHIAIHWRTFVKFGRAWRSIPVLFRHLIVFILTGSIWIEACSCAFASPGTIEEQIAERVDDVKLIETLRASRKKVENASVFPGDVYFQFYGMKVLIEPRCEVSDSPINHVADLYTRYQYLNEGASVDEINQFFEEYPFDYYLALPGSKLDLYFVMSGEYQKVEQIEGMVLYERKTQ